MRWGPNPLSPSVSRCVAGFVALCVATPLTAAAASPATAVNLQMRAAPSDTPESEIGRLYVEGQDKYSAGDFSAAADAWTRLLQRLPEAQANKATRENVLLNILQAYLDAYNRTRLDDGTKDIEHLREGKKTLDQYYNDYRRAYGDRASVSVAVQEKGDELERLLEEAEKEVAAAAAAAKGDPGGDTPPPGGDTVTDTGTTTGPTKEVIVLKPQSAGSGLIVGGAIAGAVGVGMLGLGIAGGVLGPRSEEDFLAAEAAGDDAAREEANDAGERANAMMISGLVVAAVGLGAGAALIVLGLKRRKESDDAAAKAIGVAPVIGPRFSGVALSGRF